MSFVKVLSNYYIPHETPQIRIQLPFRIHSNDRSILWESLDMRLKTCSEMLLFLLASCYCLTRHLLLVAMHLFL